MCFKCLLLCDLIRTKRRIWCFMYTQTRFPAVLQSLHAINKGPDMHSLFISPRVCLQIQPFLFFLLSFFSIWGELWFVSITSLLPPWLEGCCFISVGIYGQEANNSFNLFQSISLQLQTTFDPKDTFFTLHKCAHPDVCIIPRLDLRGWLGRGEKDCYCHWATSETNSCR